MQHKLIYVVSELISTPMSLDMKLNKKENAIVFTKYDLEDFLRTAYIALAGGTSIQDFLKAKGIK